MSRKAAWFEVPKVAMAVTAGVAALTVSAVVVQARQANKTTVQVYKTSTCGCCSKWVEHLKANGFSVVATDVEDIDAVKTKQGVPTDLSSCHTAIVNGYVVEGHVPASDVARMLKERPKIAGIAVPSMPAGSPGMEVPGGKVQPYKVIAFEKGGKTTVYSSHGSSDRR